MEFDYLTDLIRFRLGQYFPEGEEIGEPAMPALDTWRLSYLAEFIWHNQLPLYDATLLLIGLAPHVQPDLFDKAVERTLGDSTNFPKIGGVRGKNSRSFLPTGETALFLLGGDDLDARLSVQQLFGAEHLLVQRKIIWLEEVPSGEPVLSGKIIMSQDYIDTFTFGKPSPPHFSMNFPAQRIKEQRSWESLVISTELVSQINEIINWLRYNDELMHKWSMGDRLKRGYRALFHGPSGTGKTLTAGLLGKELGRDVYKIDLSMVVSKYIGETEKNLELLFARAEDKGWILFFDEADALFGKRTNVRDAHDKYANQEVSYLLQRIEDYNGLLILATNMKNNIDDAFVRRFNAILKFPFPDANQRAQIWKKALPEDAVFRRRTASGDPPIVTEELVDIPETVKKYELTGGNIINVVHYAGIKGVEALYEGNHVKQVEVAEGYPEGEEPQLTIYLSDIIDGIRRELIKEGKPFSA